MKVNTAFFISINLITAALEVIKASPDNSNCTFTNDVIICNSITSWAEDMKTIFKGITDNSFKVLKLLALNLSSFDISPFGGLPVSSLEIENCKLDQLTDGGQSGIKSNLRELKIESSINAAEVGFRLELDSLLHLKKLNLTSNVIPYLNRTWFQNALISLQYLFLERNGIEMLEERVFESFNELRSISLQENAIKHLKRDMLPNPGFNLKTLAFGKNKLSSLPSELFSGMSSLTSVDFRSNRIKNLQESVWMPIWTQLRTLVISKNPIICDSYTEWMFRMAPPHHLIGSCYSLEKGRNISLKNLIDEKRNCSIVSCTVQL
ncbi:chondroadherin-like [Stegodyphus dumicola]|uniref:chondroadherin-like n=1 Tax=Stegodyphus dumicola TaxID=202533 RepID=UPI0015A81E70|nr:chondroadherin-like [Stegodyphus dumicola]